MNPHNRPRPDDPELHRSLRELGMLKAPESLIPGVLAAIARRQTAWYRRPATSWPHALQLAFVVCSLAILTGTVVVGSHLLPTFQPVDLRGLLAEPVSRILALFGTLETLLEAGTLIGRVTVGPALFIIAAAASVFYLVLFGLGTAIWRATRQIAG